MTVRTENLPCKNYIYSMANDENSTKAIKSNISPWNHGRIQRSTAEQLLFDKKLGTFLVRESEHYPGDYTLSIKDDSKIQHYRVKILPDGSYTVDDEIFFEDLKQLIEHYELDADGLCCRLEQAVFNNNRNMNGVDDLIDSIPPISTLLPESIIDYRELTVGKTIGSGEFAEVYEGTYRKTRVAIKVLKESNSAALFLREADIMSSLKHPNLVQLLGVAQKPDNVIYLVTEFMAKGSLLHYLTTRGRSVILKTDLLGFAIDTCEGLSYLEQNHIVHRDVAASNVLIADDNTAKVSDFGLAKSAEQNECERIKCRTKWTAPEALESKKYTHKSDMWSYGILLWEIYSYGRCPYPRIPANEVLINLKQGHRMEPPDGCPVEIGEIMRQSWLNDPDKRPTFSSILDRLKQIRERLLQN
ncbi:unnamed protein product [Didymodactylos carnosus]|uniref:Tyrosine-protein kinase n=1 Tax=Didymodactylos carnosus TaxID=1234261 RepID=A0A813R5P7_9BILA|nr:unnamed protein product [Didymodactylos carnosus]CAF0820499.1 unnamed protein product [Didymodactylos carnosus]CAF3558923.1 unnamed protein product [Didymodactylos carnosus]CAF3604773.1 unnamed protein product [Didymodactylos carnosus]